MSFFAISSNKSTLCYITINFFPLVKLKKGYVDWKKKITRASINTVESGKWVKFQF